jgi:hypothetical protein
MNPHGRLTPCPALHQNRVDLPVSANTVHCIKTAWIFRNCGIASLHHCTKNRVELPGRTNKINDLLIVAKAKKTAWTGRSPQKEHASFPRHGTTASASYFVSSKETAPQRNCLPSSVNTAGGSCAPQGCWHQSEVVDDQQVANPEHSVQRCGLRRVDVSHSRSAYFHSLAAVSDP